MKYGKHSPLGGSSIARVLACNKSLQLSLKYGEEKRETAYSSRGIKLHEEAEEAIKKKKTEGLDPCIEPYVNKCIKISRFCDYSKVEVKLKHPELSMIYSTVDFLAYNKADKTLYVIDFKAGENKS